MPIKHAYTSPKSDSGDATLVQPSNWNADHVGGPAGWASTAGPAGFSGMVTFGTNQTLPANGGAAAVQVIVPAPMKVEAFHVFNGDTASARSAEMRLYLDTGTATADFVTGTDATVSFTPSAASQRTGSVSGAPVTVESGVYWAVIRNTHATNGFNLRRNSPPTIGTYTGGMRVKTIGALGSTLDLDTGWTVTAMPALWLEGRVLGRTTVIT